MTPRRCTYGAFEGEIRLEGRCLVFVARGGRREELGVVRDGFLHLDRFAEPHGTYALLHRLDLIDYQPGDRESGSPLRWRWVLPE